jgi:hypothetical protein
MSLISRKANGFNGAVADAFIAVFAVGFFQPEYLVHMSTLTVAWQILWFDTIISVCGLQCGGKQ